MKQLLIILFLCYSIPAYSDGFLFWIDKINHHYEVPPKSQLEWSLYINADGISNGAFFKSNFDLIPPYMTIEKKYNTSNPKNWWYVIDGELSSGPISDSIKPSLIISGCPVLIFNGITLPEKEVYRYTNKRFVKKGYNRTLLGKTFDNKFFIFCGSGSLFSLRSKLKDKIKNIKWLINLDGGGSSFCNLYGLPLKKTKRKTPSVLSYSIISWEIM